MLPAQRPTPEDLARASAMARTLSGISDGGSPGPALDFAPSWSSSPPPLRKHPATVPPPPSTPVQIGPFTPLWRQLAMIASGALDPLDPIRQYTERARTHNDRVGAFLSIAPPPSREPVAGRLRGAAVAVKDIFETAGIRTTAGSRQLANNIPASDAQAWALLVAEGAQLVGKTSTHEFAAGTTNENESFGPVHNPWDPERVSGGSSGGSAAAVAAGLAACALGSDTAGSIRIPAACCGVVGLKPTYGRVSRAGVIPLSWTLDHVGPISRTVRDAGLLLSALAGADPHDPSTLGQPPLRIDGLGLPPGDGLIGLRIGVPMGWLSERTVGGTGSGDVPTDPEIAACLDEVLATCRDLGAQVRVVDLGPAEDAARCNRVIAFAESTAYHQHWLEHSPQLYGEKVYRRLLAGRFIPAVDYLQAQRLRAAIAARHMAALDPTSGVDFFALPTLPIVAPPIGASDDQAGALVRFCAPFNVTGLPAITIPACFSAAGLPIGLQLVARPWDEEGLLAVAAALEEALGHARALEDGRRRPRLG